MTKTSRFSLRHLIVAFAVAGGMGMVAPSAEACGDGWWPEVEIDYRVEGIARAEKNLADGNYLASAGAVIRMIPHIRGYKSAQQDAIINRSMRVLAVAMARSGGDLTSIAKELPDFSNDSWLPADVRASFAGATAEDRIANLEWSVRALKALRKVKKDDAKLASELGEALAQLPERHNKAKKLLERLANKDLLTSPEAYRALAKLRAEAGDETGRTAALNRCRDMAKDASYCVVPTVAVSGQS
jgi:hypothetical protein